MPSFLDLPGEIRTQIYKFAIPRGEITSIEVDSGKVLKQRQPGITRTCRQVRSECPAFWEEDNVAISKDCRFWAQVSFTLPKVACVTDSGDYKVYGGCFEERFRAIEMEKALTKLYVSSTKSLFAL